VNPHGTAVSRRHADRSARVCADCSETEAGSDGGSRSAGSAAGDSIMLPWVMDGTEVADGRGGAEGNFMQILFAEQDSPRGFQPAHNLRILNRHAIGEYRARCRRPAAGCIDIVLQSDWDTVKRATPSALPDFELRLAGLRERLLGSHGDQGVYQRVQTFDSIEACPREI
jgi:hypothetical protein